jgi:hypothetical protein
MRNAAERRRHKHQRLMSIRQNSYVEEHRCIGVFTSGGDSSGDPSSRVKDIALATG